MRGRRGKKYNNIIPMLGSGYVRIVSFGHSWNIHHIGPFLFVSFRFGAIIFEENPPFPLPSSPSPHTLSQSYHKTHTSLTPSTSQVPPFHNKSRPRRSTSDKPHYNINININTPPQRSGKPGLIPLRTTTVVKKRRDSYIMIDLFLSRR